MATEPLVIVNKALGYKILYQLEEFQVDYKNNSMMYLGFPLFEEMGSKKRWKKAREKAYQGSVMNFMRCLYDNKLQQEGYVREHRMANKVARPGRIDIMGDLGRFQGLALGSQSIRRAIAVRRSIASFGATTSPPRATPRSIIATPTGT